MEYLIGLIKDPKVLTVLISSVTSIATVFLLKPFVDKRFHVFKLKKDYEHEQRKNLKNTVAKYKIHFLNACESMNHRLWNYSSNWKRRWLHVDGQYDKESKHYFSSFIYRTLSVYAWIKIIEKNLVYIDTTVATKEDLSFLKYMKLFPLIFCDLVLFHDLPYNPDIAKDHFFRNLFDGMASCLIKDDGVISFEEFKATEMEKYFHICGFFDGINPEEERLRWDRLHLFHITLILFLNSFGYDFQYTPKTALKELMASQRESRILKCFPTVLYRLKLEKQKEVRSFLKSANLKLDKSIKWSA
jgi:hypothetical protein